MDSWFDFQPPLPAGQYQQQYMHYPVDPNEGAYSMTESDVQLFIIIDWIKGLEARLWELRQQLDFTLSFVDPCSPDWFGWHEYLGQQFNFLASGVAIHRSWLLYLQQLQYEQQQQQFLQQAEETEYWVVTYPQRRYVEKLRWLNKRIELAYNEGRKEGQTFGGDI